jgi:hypothetical protein
MCVFILSYMTMYMYVLLITDEGPLTETSNSIDLCDTFVL